MGAVMPVASRVDLSPSVNDALIRMAKERGMTKPALVREALGVLQTIRSYTAEGYTAGLVKDRGKLDVVLGAPIP